MLRELVVLGLLGCAGMWATGLLDASANRLGDNPAEAAQPKQWTAKCEEIITRFEASYSGMAGDAQNMGQAFAQTAKQAIMLTDFKNDLKAANCPSNASELNEATAPR